MTRKLALFPSKAVKGKGQSFVGVKRVVIPNQSMTLHEILERFTRKEALPVMREGYYETRFGDIEKMSMAPIDVQRDYAENMKQFVKRNGERIKAENEEKLRKEKEANSPGDPNAKPPI